jgi:hypothetical protein
MIEHVSAEAPSSDWYAEACRRARASGRRRQGAHASTRWPVFAPPVAMSGGPLGAVQAADREIARQTARRARAVAEFASSRPASSDRGQGEPGAMSAERWAGRAEVLRPVSEWAARELVVALSISEPAAEALLERSLLLVERLPGTLAALEAGALHPGHLWPMLEKVAPIENDRLRAEVEAELLRWAAGRVTTPAQLGAKARREVARRNARQAARDLQRALKERGVHLGNHPTDGMATLTVVATLPEAQALYRTLVALAETVGSDTGEGQEEPRTRGQKMVDALLDLVLRPGESGLPPVQVLLTVVASVATLVGGDQPGEIDGRPVPAELIRQLLAAFTDGAPKTPTEPESPAEDAEPAIGPADLADLAEQAELETWWADVERRVLAGELVDPDPEPMPDPVPDTVPGPVLGGMSDTVPTTVPDTVPDAVPDGDPDRWLDAACPPDDPADPPPPDGRGGWWAAADRAVADAEQALLHAGHALTHARRLVNTATRADAADEASWQTSGPGRVTAATDALTALRAASAEQWRWLADLLADTAGGGLADRPRIALTDALSGALLALTDLPGLRRAGTCGRPGCRRRPARCVHDLTGRPGLGPPGQTKGYRPGAELDRFVRARDRRCRFPGCRRRVPEAGELDHHTRYPLGPTDAANLAGYCTTDHRGKHQAPGWRHELAPDGTLTVTTPTGLVAVTTPPPY